MHWMLPIQQGLLVLCVLLIPCRSCRTVSSWTDLQSLKRQALRENLDTTPTLVFCPFNIVKPASEVLDLKTSINLKCQTARKCIIGSEGGTHIRVSAPPSEQVQLTGLVLRGATTGAIQVQSSSVLTLVKCDLRSNQALQQGGALLVQSNARVVIRYTNFIANSAPRGAAIAHSGVQLTIQNSLFRSNIAGKSGVIQVYDDGDLTARLARADLISTTFKGNNAGSATNAGMLTVPLIGDVIVRTNITGQDNQGCNGMFIQSKLRCYNFVDIPFVLGNLTLQESGIALSQGLSIDLLAQSGQLVQLTSPNATSTFSVIPFHTMPDGAVILPGASDGSNFYVSNSEASTKGTGGVYRLHLDSRGRPLDYLQLLTNTTRNCNGGLTPWNTFVSCEEVPGGQCWQVDPTRVRSSQKTVLGGAAGGSFEAVAVDDRNASRLQFFLSEDALDGAIRRYRPSSSVSFGWDLLHGSGGTLDYLQLLPSSMTFQWTANITTGRVSASNYFKNVEGIICNHGKVYFVSKVQKELIVLDLDLGTYTKSSTLTSLLPGGGKFESQPDQVLMGTPDGLSYFTEDGGKSPGIFVSDGSIFRALLEAYDGMYNQSETTGIEFSPDGMYMLFCIQENGFLFQARRLDGLPFGGQQRVLKWKYGLGRR